MSRKMKSAFGNYKTRKDRRREWPFTKRVDPHCRNHGECPYCLANRMHADIVRRRAADEQLESWLKTDKQEGNEEDD